MFKFNVITKDEIEEYTTRNIGPRDFHKSFFTILRSFQVLDGPIPKWTYVLKVIMTLCVLIALFLLSLSIYHGFEIFDIPFMTEAGVYFLIMLYKLLILSCTKLNVPNYYALQHIMQKDFEYIYGRGVKYRAQFIHKQLLTRKIFRFAVIFIGVGMLLFAVCSLIFYMLTHISGEGQRPLLFPFWMFEIDFGLSPTYEIAFMFSNVCICAYAFNYIFMIGTQIVWIREIAVKADIVIWSIEELMEGIQPTRDTWKKNYFDSLLRHRMKKIIQHHHSMHTLMDHYAQVYKKILLFEQKICAPVVCLSAYAAAEKWDAGEFNAILMLLCVAVIILVFIPSYLCTFLSIKKMVSAYSFFNMLRQANV